MNQVETLSLGLADGPSWQMTNTSERALFEAALDVPADARKAFIEEQVAGDEALASRVRKLLDVHHRMQETRAVSASLLDMPPSPTTIGPYRILELIDEGGMGAVHLAEQTTPVRRRVAIKIIKLGMDTKEVIARFMQERQALAMMNHPHIARLLDAGSTDDGRPYFVMEYVPGVPVHEYCDRTRMSVDDRLRLFSNVCRAVEHAHERGIVHRDLKPGNILVTEEQGRAHPMVIDFGIAKALDQQLTDHTVRTQLGVAIGTPAYMSPEQTGVSPGSIDPRTDVYSLGVLLYELLVGVLPIVFSPEDALGLDEIQREIREQFPMRPSVRLRTLDDDDAEVIAACRSTSQTALRRRVAGDVDWVVMKTLEKEPDRRYASVSELASEVERAARGIPVHASPPSAGHYIRRMMRSPRVRAATAAAIGLPVLGAAALGLVNVFRASNAVPVARWQQVTFRGDVLLSAMTPDGEWIAYVTRTADDRNTLHVNALGAADGAREVLTQSNIASIDWSEDGTRLLVASANYPIGAPSFPWTLSIMDRDGAVVDTRSDVSSWARWVGARLSWGNINRGITLEASTGERTPVDIPWPWDWFLDWESAPDGESVAVVTLYEQLFTLGKLYLDGSEHQVLARSAEVVLAPRWSSDGRSMFFVIGEGPSSKLLKLDVTSPGPTLAIADTLLTGMLPYGNSETGRTSLDVTRDRRRLGYVRRVAESNLWVVTLDGSDGVATTRRLTTGSTLKMRPTISPDGQWVAFSDVRGTGADVYRTPFAGGQIERLTTMNTLRVNEVEWAPSGDVIAFLTFDQEPNAWLLDAETGAISQMGAVLGGEIFLIWMPNGALVVNTDRNNNYRVLHGGEVGARLFEPADGFRFPSPPSPDGTRIAYHWNQGSRPDLWVRSLEDSTDVLVIPLRSTQPIGWTADGERLYFVDNSDIRAIYRIHLESRDIVRFGLPFEVEFEHVAMHPDGRSFVVSAFTETSDVWLADGFDPDAPRLASND